MSTNWAVGAREFKKELLEMCQDVPTSFERGEAGVYEVSRAVWEERITTYLAALKKTEHLTEDEPKGASWKVAVAAAMKTETTASNPWLARRLNMGSPFRLSRLVSACRANPAAFQPYVTAIANCKV